MILQLSTQRMKDKQYTYSYKSSSRLEEQNTERSLCIRLRYLDIVFTFITRTGDFRKRYGL